MRLLAAIDRHERLARRRRNQLRRPCTGRSDADARRTRLSRSRLDDIAPEVVRVARREALEAVTHGPQPALDGLWRIAACQLTLDQRQHGQFVLANAVGGSGHGRTDRLADDHQQVQRNARACTEIVEGLIGQGREHVEGRVVEEVERDLPVLDLHRERLQGQPGRGEVAYQSDLANVTRGELVADALAQHPELQDPVQGIDADVGALGGLLHGVVTHLATVGRLASASGCSRIGWPVRTGSVQTEAVTALVRWLITVAALLNLGQFDFAHKPGHIVYVGAYVVVAVVLAVAAWHIGRILRQQSGRAQG